MAELTTLEEKPTEVPGPAGAAQKATGEVAGPVDGEGIAERLRQMREERISEPTRWAPPSQERHFGDVEERAPRPAGGKDPYEES